MTDLVQLARKSQNYVLQNPDRRLGWVPHFSGRILSGPPCYAHEDWDACDVGWRMVEAGEVIRRMTGDSMTKEEECLRKMVFSTLAPDGLSYRRLEAWCPHEAWMWDQGRALLALNTLMEREDAPHLVRITEEMLRALERIAIPYQKRGLYYPMENWMGNGWGASILAHPPTGLQIEGAVLFAERTGQECALQFARRVAYTVLNRSPLLLNENGGFVHMGGGDFPATHFTHLHSRLFISLGLARLASVTGDTALFALTRRALDYVLSLSTSYGWVPERSERKGSEAVDELCCIMDVIKLALFFAERGETDLYDLVERFVANQVTAHQINDYDRVADRLDLSPPPADTRSCTYQGVLDRFLGGFTGSLTPEYSIRVLDDMPFLDVSGCCGPSGIMCLYLAWEAAIEEQGDRATVWMHFSRDGDLILVESLVSGGGHLRITAKRELKSLRVRIHPWADRSLVCATAENARLPIRYEGNLAVLDRVLPHVPVSIRYPSPARRSVERVAERVVPVDWNGNEVVGIPPQAGLPALYPFPR
ncbi:MAG: hypothetical protein V1800_03915 [Candidatus Latescibacterota bacterium]